MKCRASVNGLDVVWDGNPVSVDDPDEIALVAAACRDRYDWPVTPGPAGLDAPYGAPAAGPPPYRAYWLEPETVHAFGTDGDLGPRSTRFEF